MSPHLSTHTHTTSYTNTYIECVCLSEPLSAVPVVPNEEQTNEGQRGDETTGTRLWGGEGEWWNTSEREKKKKYGRESVRRQLQREMAESKIKERHIHEAQALYGRQHTCCELWLVCGIECKVSANREQISSFLSSVFQGSLSLTECCFNLKFH